jgi:hypothetical protein
MAPADRETYTVGGGSAPPGTDESSWKRRRESFSCTDEIWDRGKTAWASARRSYPAWTEWLESAIQDKTAAVRVALGVTDLPAAPERLPTGRRSPSPTNDTRSRRSFTVVPAIWAEARAAWWAQESDYPAWTDWVEEAIAEKAARTEQPAISSTH